MAEAAKPDFNSGEPLGYIDGPDGRVRWEMVERVCHVTVQQKMSDELKNLLSRRLKSHSVSFLMNTLTLMHTISINLGQHPDLRAQLADAAFFERFQRLALVRDARISTAVLQLLVDWNHMFRSEPLGARSHGVLQVPALRFKSKPRVTPVAEAYAREPNSDDFVPGFDFGGSGLMSQPSINSSRQPSLSSPQQSLATSESLPHPSTLIPRGSGSGEPPAAASAAPPNPTAAAGDGDRLAGHSEPSRPPPPSVTPSATPPPAASVRAARGDAAAAPRDTPAVERAQQPAARARGGAGSQAAELMRAIERCRSQLCSATSSLHAAAARGDQAEVRERHAVGERARNALEGHREELRRLVTTPLDDGVLEQLLVMNDDANTAIAAWKSGLAAATVVMHNAGADAGAVEHRHSIGPTADRPAPAAARASDGHGDINSEPTTSNSGRFWTAHSGRLGGGHSGAIHRSVQAAAAKIWGTNASKSDATAAKDAALSETPSVPAPGQPTHAREAREVESSSRQSQSSSGGTASLPGSDLQQFAHARARVLEADNNKLKAHVAELEAKLARDLVTHRQAQKRIAELEQARNDANLHSAPHPGPSTPGPSVAWFKSPALTAPQRFRLADILHAISDSDPAVR